MENLVFENKFKKIFFIDDNKEPYLSVFWKADSINMVEKDFQESILAYQKVMLKHKVKYTMVDTRIFDFIVTPELQSWHNETVMPVCFEAGLRKVGFILPKDLFVNISINQTFEALNTVLFQNFENKEDTLEWFFETTQPL